MSKQTASVKTPLERSINSRHRAIERMELNITKIEEEAAKRVAEIRHRISERKVLLDALRRGALKE